MPQSHRIECRCERKYGRPGKPSYLGDIQCDTPNTARHHCKNCNTTYEHTVDSEGKILRKIVDGKIIYSEAKVVFA